MILEKNANATCPRCAKNDVGKYKTDKDKCHLVCHNKLCQCVSGKFEDTNDYENLYTIFAGGLRSWRRRDREERFKLFLYLNNYKSSRDYYLNKLFDIISSPACVIFNAVILGLTFFESYMSLFLLFLLWSYILTIVFEPFDK